MQSPEAGNKGGLGAAVTKVAEAFASGRVSAGERAELRRMALDAVPPAPFWHVMARLVEPYHSAPSTEQRRTDWEKSWATVLTGMALLDHASNYRPGRALAEAGFHELRLRRLLRASGGRLSAELLSAARYLAAQGSSWDWNEAARLVHYDLNQTSEWADAARRRIARDYFGTIHTSE